MQHILNAAAPSLFFRGLIKFAFIAISLCLIVAGGFLIGGFLKFTDTVTSYETSAKVKNASAIVVFTGGNSRIDEAVKLLKDGKGQRLLITGVHPNISTKTLQKKFHIEENLFNCCVDIDKQAANTHGNAVETGKWSSSHKFDSFDYRGPAPTICRAVCWKPSGDCPM